MKGINAMREQNLINNKHVIEFTCKIQWYTICILAISLLGIMGFITFNARKLKLLKDHLFSNVPKVMLFISNEQYYVPL